MKHKLLIASILSVGATVLAIVGSGVSLSFFSALQSSDFSSLGIFDFLIILPFLLAIITVIIGGFGTLFHSRFLLVVMMAFATLTVIAAAYAFNVTLWIAGFGSLDALVYDKASEDSNFSNIRAAMNQSCISNYSSIGTCQYLMMQLIGFGLLIIFNIIITYVGYKNTKELDMPPDSLYFNSYYD